MSLCYFIVMVLPIWPFVWCQEERAEVPRQLSCSLEASFELLTSCMVRMWNVTEKTTLNLLHVVP